METKFYTGVAVKCNDKVLLCKRNHDGSYPGMWSIPAGKIEKGETALAAAYREFYEETNINISSKNLTKVASIPRYTRDGKKIKGIMTVFLLEVDEELVPDFANAKDGSEHSEWAYFTMNKIESNKTGTDLYEVLRNILK
jgi:8-oxo-dGTP pyrophosphatase MutT (NUDIX family)